MMTFHATRPVETPNGGEIEVTFVVEIESGCPATLECPADPADANIVEAYIENGREISSDRIKKLLDGKGAFAVSFQNAAELAIEDAEEQDRESMDCDYDEHPSDHYEDE